MPLVLRFSDCSKDIVVLWAKQPERPDLAVTNDAAGINHENRSRYLSGNQRLRSIKICYFSIYICQQTQWQLVISGKTLV